MNPLATVVRPPGEEAAVMRVCGRVWRVGKWVGLIVLLSLVALWAATVPLSSRGGLYCTYQGSWQGSISSGAFHATIPAPEQFRFADGFDAFWFRSKFRSNQWTWRDACGFVLPRIIKSGGFNEPVRERSSRLSELLYSGDVSRTRYVEPSVTIRLPLWLPIVLVMLPTAVLWYCDFRRKRPGHCRRCGYDLTKNESGRCPECGMVVAVAQ